MTSGRQFTRTPRQGQIRAVVKTLCYRLLMISITISVAWLITGNVADALNIGLVTNFVKTGTYYFYERIWDRIAWGIGPNSA